MAFNIPNIVGRVYSPGPQPNSPGNSHMPWDSWKFQAIPWPNAVPVLNVLASNPGTPRAMAGQPFVNRFASMPADYLKLSGVVSKS